MRIWSLLTILLLSAAAFAESPGNVVRGKLTQREGKPPAIETAEHKLVRLSGDEATMGVLRDKRLADNELEVTGHFSNPDAFAVDPIHTKAVHVHKDGKNLLVTYWCDVCSIRTYTPGKCWCCQKETALDLREPGQE
jgi:hypothetical protein